MPKPTARQARETNKRQRGENHNRDQRLDGHDSHLENHDSDLSNHNGRLNDQKGRLDGHDKDVSDIRKGDTFNSNAIKGGPLGSLSHTQTADGQSKDPLGNANKQQDSQRAVATPGHMATEILRPYHAPDDTWENRHLKGSIPNNKLQQDMSVFARSENVYNKGANDDRFLKSDLHPQFGKGHGNDHHDPDFAPKNAPKSIAFNSLPTDAIERVLAKRNQIRSNRDNNVTNAAAIANLQEAYLHLAHMLLDSPEMTGDAGLAAMQEDSAYRQVWELMQTIAAPENAWFLNNRGPDIASTGGVYGSLGPTDQAWYPPKEMSLAGSGVMVSPSTNILRADLSSVPIGQWVYLVVTGRSPNVADYSFPNSFNWNRIFPEPISGQNRYIQIFRKQKTSGDTTTVDVVFSGSAANLPFNGVWFSAANQGSVNEKTSLASGLIPESGVVSALGKLQYPRGLSFHLLVVDGQNYDFDIGGGLTEIIRNQVTVNGATTTLIAAYRYSEAGDVQSSLPIVVKSDATGAPVSSVRYALLTTNSQPRKKTLQEAKAEANL